MGVVVRMWVSLWGVVGVCAGGVCVVVGVCVWGVVVRGVYLCVGCMCEVSMWWWLWHLWSGIEVVGTDRLTGTWDDE